jgi:hypothetical protein
VHLNKLEDFEVNREEEKSANDETGEVVEMEVCLSKSLPVIWRVIVDFMANIYSILPLLTECRERRRRVLSWSITVQIYYRPICHNEQE